MSKVILTTQEKAFIKANVGRFTNGQILDHLNANRQPGLEPLKITTLRTRMYKMGIKRCEILRWTEHETAFLIKNYATMGNIEIAKSLNKKGRKFTKKNVEKKIVLMGLVRTPESLEQIRLAHQKAGSYARGVKKMWEKRGVLQLGQTTVWTCNGRLVEVIKTEDGIKHNSRYQYELHNGPVPQGHKVYHKDGNSLNNHIDNLVALPAQGVNNATRKLHRKYHLLNTSKLKDNGSAPSNGPIISKMDAVKEGKIRVVINKKTTVFVRPGTNIKALMARYNNL